MTVARACVMSVAIAAPATPSAGIGPQPKMNSGSSARFKQHRHEHDIHRNLHDAQAAHQRLIDVEAEHEHETEERVLGEGHGVGQDVWLGAHEPHQWLAQDEADRRNHDRYGQHHEQRLGGDVIHGPVVAAALVLGDEDGAGDAAGRCRWRS